MRRNGYSLLLVTLLVLMCTGRTVTAGALRDEKAPSGVMGAAALWERFTSHLRAGRMQKAYDCFSPRSKDVFPYDSFCAHYHPLTAASEATLSPLDTGQFRLSGDLAQLRFLAARQPAGTKQASIDWDSLVKPSGNASRSTPAGVFITALLVREEGTWYLVAAACEAQARVEAETRNLLRRLWQAPHILYARKTNHPINAATVQASAPKVFASNEAVFCLQSYSIALVERYGSLRLEATPRRKGLQGFFIHGTGEVKTMVTADAVALPTKTTPTAKNVPAHTTPTLPPPAPNLGDPSETPPPPAPELDDPVEATVTTPDTPVPSDWKTETKTKTPPAPRPIEPPALPEPDTAKIMDTVPMPAMPNETPAPQPKTEMRTPTPVTPQPAAEPEEVDEMDLLPPGIVDEAEL